VLALSALTAAHAKEKFVITPVAGKPVLSLGSFDLALMHYVVEEFFLAGTADSYETVGEPSAEGHWDVKVRDRSPFKTRVVVIRPTDPRRFNGTVVVEWLNVTAGTDGAPDWNYTHTELIREGYAYMGVSAQKVGIDGGGLLGIPGILALKMADPERYASLSHPGDAFAYDIFSRAGRAVRGIDGARLLGPLTAKRVLATGESQSAVFLTTYVDAVHPIAGAFDGFLIHSRFGSGASLDGASIGGNQPGAPAGLRIRADMRKPVLILISETDLMSPMGYLAARQDDNDHLRVWEVAGTAHADTYTLGASAIDSGGESIADLARAFAPTTNVMGMQFDKPINSAPQHHYVMVAAISALNRWVSSGKPPPHGERLMLTDGTPPQLARDPNGNATGGVRSPWVDVPTAHLSGLGQTGSPMGFLFGVTEPFDSSRLAQLYPGGRAEYLEKFGAALNAAIRAGFILPADEAQIRALASFSYPVGP
jgi:Alpha/beta hydrolase domain